MKRIVDGLKNHDENHKRSQELKSLHDHIFIQQHSGKRLGNYQSEITKTIKRLGITNNMETLDQFGNVNRRLLGKAKRTVSKKNSE